MKSINTKPLTNFRHLFNPLIVMTRLHIQILNNTIWDRFLLNMHLFQRQIVCIHSICQTHLCRQQKYSTCVHNLQFIYICICIIYICTYMTCTTYIDKYAQVITQMHECF